MLFFSVICAVLQINYSNEKNQYPIVSAIGTT